MQVQAALVGGDVVESESEWRVCSRYCLRVVASRAARFTVSFRFSAATAGFWA